MSKVIGIIETELMRPLESMQQIDRSVSVCVCLCMMDSENISTSPVTSVPVCNGGI